MIMYLYINKTAWYFISIGRYSAFHRCKGIKCPAGRRSRTQGRSAKFEACAGNSTDWVGGWQSWPGYKLPGWWWVMMCVYFQPGLQLLWLLSCRVYKFVADTSPLTAGAMHLRWLHLPLWAGGRGPAISCGHPGTAQMSQEVEWLHRRPQKSQQGQRDKGHWQVHLFNPCLLKFF